MNDIPAKKCCGCLACIEICPTGALVQDESGSFKKPIINTELCIDCKKCSSVCPQSAQRQSSPFVQRAYAIQHKNEELLAQSTSGGAFSPLAATVLKAGGVVYGCVLDGSTPRHVRTENDISGMRGSKYVQSDMTGIHSAIVCDLSAGKRVLFSGTPCQCASVFNLCLNKRIKTDNLLLVDFICHGTPSAKIFEDYARYCEKKRKKRLENHLFRSKVNGWTRHTEMNIFEGGERDFTSYESQLFKSIFYSHLAMSEACFECKYTTKSRASDITLADFWGVRACRPELFSEKGLSFVLVNSERGEAAILECENIAKVEVSPDDSAQPHLCEPCKRPPEYEKFWRDYNTRGFEYVVKKYYCGGRLRRLASKIYHALFGVFKKK